MYVGTELLIGLSKDFGPAREVWRALSVSPHAPERRIAAACMGDQRVPLNLDREVLGGLLADRSTLVRTFAVQSERSRNLAHFFTQFGHRS
jgi:hypothetical protein